MPRSPRWNPACPSGGQRRELHASIATAIRSNTEHKHSCFLYMSAPSSPCSFIRKNEGACMQASKAGGRNADVRG
eukprot:640804-Rhodomonas_salina.1